MKLYDIAINENILTHVTIELTTQCNWRCKHCFIEDYTSVSYLNMEILDYLFFQMREMGVVDILFTGGEMFIRPDVIDILKLARSYYFDVSLFTNLSLVNEEQIDEIKKMGISLVSCTVFSLDETVHDNFVQNKGALNKTIKNIELLCKKNVPVEIKHIITSENQNEYKKVKMFCEKKNIHFLATTSIFPRRSNNNDNQEMLVNKKYLMNNLACIDEIRNFSRTKIEEEDYACNATRYSLFVQANGDILPCSMLTNSIGNIFLDNLAEVWNSNRYLKYLQNLRYKDLTYCMDCENVSLCYRCSGVAKQESGSLLGCSTSERRCADVRKSLSKDNIMYREYKTANYISC